MLGIDSLPYLPSFGGGVIAAFLVLVLGLFVVGKSHKIAVLLDRAYESMYDFFGDILGERELSWIKGFVTNLFFVILLYNILGLITDFIAPIFGYDTVQGEFFLSQYVSFGTAEPHFNIAMAIVGVVVSLGIQFVSMPHDSIIGYTTKKSGGAFFKILNFVYEYIPVWGKGIITVEKGSMSPFIFYPLWLVVKIFDIVISLFVGFLDIVGILAKVISLAFRLFGNMISGTALLTVLILGLSAGTYKLIGYELPLIAPLILVLQGLLVACIQAFVFPLLIAIFIKVARMSDDDNTATA